MDFVLKSFKYFREELLRFYYILCIMIKGRVCFILLIFIIILGGFIDDEIGVL